MRNRLRFAQGAAMLALVAGCAADDGAGDPVAQTRTAIINGTVMTADAVGVVKVLTPFISCSGTIIAPNWVLTAAHCLSASTEGVSAERSSTGEIRAAAQTYTYPSTGATVDVGLIRVAQPFSIATNASGYSNPLWAGAATDLVGRTVQCLGYGVNTTSGAGYGTLRSANLAIASYDASSWSYLYNVNAQGQIQAPGDSGSGCFYTSNGQRYHVSVLSGVGNDYATAVASTQVRAWVDQNVRSRCNDGIQSGAEQGIDCGGSCAACPPAAVLSYTSLWDTGWCADVIITNHTGFPTSSWTVGFNVNSSSVYTLWNANYTNSGSAYTATNLAWNGQLASRASTRFGVCANKTGANWQPTITSATLR